MVDINFATGLCGTLADGLVQSATCEEWAGSFDNDFLDEQAAALTGATCVETADGWVANCIAGIDVATSVYVMDPSGASAAWSNFVTWNGVSAGQGAAGCAAAGLDIPSCIAAGVFDPAWLTDDSANEMDPSCLADGDFSD